MTINNIKEKYGKTFTYCVVDEDECYWDDCGDGRWTAVGEFGWFVSDEEVEANGIAGVTVHKEDGLVCIHVDGYLG